LTAAPRGRDQWTSARSVIGTFVLGFAFTIG